MVWQNFAPGLKTYYYACTVHIFLVSSYLPTVNAIVPTDDWFIWGKCLIVTTRCHTKHKLCATGSASGLQVMDRAVCRERMMQYPWGACQRAFSGWMLLILSCAKPPVCVWLTCDVKVSRNSAWASNAPVYCMVTPKNNIFYMKQLISFYLLFLLV